MFLPSSPRQTSASSSSFHSKIRSFVRKPQRTAAIPRMAHNGGMTPDNHDALLIVLLDRIAHQDEAALKALYDQYASKL